MDDAWTIYFDELFPRAQDIPDQQFNRAEDMSEAAHEAYEATVDRLVNQLDMGEVEALALTKAFGREVKAWVDEEVYDWDDLQARLEEVQDAFDPSGV